MSNTLIIGMGEIGKSLYNVLSKEYNVYVYDPKTGSGLVHCDDLDILHICFPYSDKFVDAVKNYQNLYTPKYTVIHSTVPVGVYDEIEAISSPCLGIHPHLEKSMTTFTKFLGGKKASEVADYFRRAGIKVYLVDDPKATAVMKILDTTFYAMCIEYTKDVKLQCEKLNIPFELWTVWTENYNKGYDKLGYPEYTRPNLTPIMKPQGGHCTIPNLKLLDTPFTNFIEKQNGL